MRHLLVAIALLLALPATTSAQSDRRVLFVPAGSVPVRVRRTVERLIATRSVLVSYETYARAAAERDLYPSNIRAIRTVATQQGAEVIVVAGYGGHHRRRVLTLRYFDGRTGELLTRRNHGLRGQHLRAASQHGILRDLEAAAGGGSGATAPPPESEGEPPVVEAGGGDGDGLPPPVDWGAPQDAANAAAADPEPSAPHDDEAEGAATELRQWGFSVALGVGIAQRQSTIPTMAGPARLTTVPFPAIQGEILGYVRPNPTERLRVALAIRYTTSVGLLAEDQLVDGTTRTTDMRSHHLTLGVRTNIPLSPGDKPTELLLEAGWGFRMLDSEIRVSIPDYTLHGLYARVGLLFNVADTPLSIGIIPEIGHMMNLSDELTQVGMVGDGFAVGAEAQVRLQVIDEVSVQLMYRESHAFLGTGFDEDMNDVERYGVLRAEYVF